MKLYFDTDLVVLILYHKWWYFYLYSWSILWKFDFIQKLNIHLFADGVSRQKRHLIYSYILTRVKVQWCTNYIGHLYRCSSFVPSTCALTASSADVWLAPHCHIHSPRICVHACACRTWRRGWPGSDRRWGPALGCRGGGLAGASHPRGPVDVSPVAWAFG